MPTVTALIALLGVVVLGHAEPARALPAGAAAPGELLARFAPDTEAAERGAARTEADVQLERTLPVRGLQLLEVEAGQSVARAVAELERSDEVHYAEPNFYRSSSVTPNDSYFGWQWGLAGISDADIDAPEAWDLETGDPAVRVAVVDSGVDHTHPDLAPNLWTNPGETGLGRESNGIDDDLNGLRDDWRGWDWVGADSDPSDDNGHGTHVAGIAAARGNDDLGVAGVAWEAALMPLRVLDAQGAGTVADAISAYRYAAAHGAEVVNASVNGSYFSQAEADAISAVPQTLFVVAAGNGGPDGIGDDNDLVPQYPCNHAADNLVCVAASDRNDALAGFSNYGRASVDLAAPGVDVLSDQPGGSYAYLNGTSMATPHVAGSAALVFAARPDASPVEVKQALLAGTDPKPDFADRIAGGGRLNAAGALASTPPP